MRINIPKIIVTIASVVILIMIGVVIGINIKSNKDRPVFVMHSGGEWTLEQGLEAEMIYNNFWSFARASYILVGEIPDCQFYKIASEVERNDFDKESFYIDDSGSFMYYHDALGAPVTSVAIDVSAFQEYVDWEQVKASGVDVAIIRVGYRGYGSGEIVLDDMFESHIQEAIDADIRVGVYFYSQALNYEEGVEEANFVLNNIRNYNVTCPVVIDTEMVYDDAARTNELDNSARTDGVVGFCETVKAAGYTPMIYSNRNWYAQSLDMTRLGEYKLWLAHYANQPDFPYMYTGWQYTDQGYIYGVEGPVDLNVWFE